MIISIIWMKMGIKSSMSQIRIWIICHSENKCKWNGTPLIGSTENKIDLYNRRWKDIYGFSYIDLYENRFAEDADILFDV